MRRRSLTALGLALLASAGCGGFGGNDVTERVVEPGVLSQKQVDRQPAGSPQRAVFEWWRALQFRNPIEAVRYYTDAQHMTPERMSKLLKAADPVLNNRPRFVDAEISGDKAIVRVMLEKITRNPNGRVDRERKPQAFNLAREGGSWKLAENLYLDEIYRTYRSFTAPLREERNSGE